MGVYWECQRCTACCRWPGEVKVSEVEIRAMAGYLGVKESLFIERYTRLRQDRRGLALTEQADGACVFLQGTNCIVQPVKPQQCRDFPNRWRADESLMRLCRAKPVWVPDEAGETHPAGNTLQPLPLKAP